MHKSRYGWSRRFLFSPLAGPLVSRLAGVNSLHVTLGGKVFGIGTAVAFLHGEWLLGAVLYFVVMFLDDLDGKLSRFRGDNERWRGSLDFLLDGCVVALIVLVIAAKTHTYLLLIAMTILFLTSAASSLMYNWRERSGDLYPEMNKEFGGGSFLDLYTRVQSYLDRYRLHLIPTTGDVLFLMFVVGPVIIHLTGSISVLTPILIVSIVLLLPGLFGYVYLALKLARK